MKKHLTKDKILHIVHHGQAYNIPARIANKYTVDAHAKVSSGAILADDFFAELVQKYTRAGVLLKGLRHREGLSQVKFAKKIHITQSDLSKMECGKRPIGKTIAKRIADVFDVNYRVFLE